MTLVNDSPRSGDHLHPVSARILDWQREQVDVVTLTVEAPSDYGLWRPGQYNMLYGFGRGEVAISIAGGDPAQGFFQHTIRDVGPVTHFLTQPDQAHIWLRGPFGRGWPPIPPDHDLVLVGGGLGFAPLRPLFAFPSRPISFRSCHVMYVMRSPGEALYRREWEAWRQSPALTFWPVAEEQTVDWTEAVGRVTDLLPHLHLDTSRTHVFTCGPEIMMRHVSLWFEEHGVRASYIHLSMERAMKCAVRLCGRCQWGPFFVCQDGPVFCLEDVQPFLSLEEF